MTESMNQSMSDKGVRRTAPATPDLLIKISPLSKKILFLTRNFQSKLLYNLGWGVSALKTNKQNIKKIVLKDSLKINKFFDSGKKIQPLNFPLRTLMELCEKEQRK